MPPDVINLGSISGGSVLHNSDTGEAVVYDRTGAAVAVIQGLPANPGPFVFQAMENSTFAFGSMATTSF